MALKERITDEMKAALLGGDRFVGETLRNLKAAILDEEVAKGARETGLSDADIEKILMREIKKRNESAKIYRDNARDDLAAPEEREVSILQTFLPPQLSEQELERIIAGHVAKLENPGPQSMGQIIGAVKQEVGTTADGAMIARLVKTALTK